MFAVGGFCFLLVIGTLAEGQIYQALARQDLELSPESAAALAAGRPEPGTPLGTIAIPQAGIDAVILEGTSSTVLRRGVGHFPGTGLPGSRGNFALAAHRDTFFRDLRHIQPDDRVEITTPQETFVYQVESTRVVEPTAVDVLEEQKGGTLTLITCYPFTYIGPAPQRFVVTARLIPE